MKKKILICGILPPPYFGHSMIYHTLMNSVFKEEFDVTFLNLKFWSYEKHKKITILKLFKFLQYYLQYIYLALIKRPDYILYAISFDKMPLIKDYVFCMTGRILGCKYILHDMGQYLKVLYDSGSGFHKFCLRSMLKHASGSVVLGEITRNVYEGFINKEQVVSVLGSVDDSRKDGYVPTAEQSKEGTHVLYFSFLAVSKGVWTGLKAAAKVIKQNRNIRFTFAGPFESPELKEQIEAFVREQNLQDNITLTGYVGNDEERTGYYRSADIFIFPTHRDVFGLVLLHALAEGVPIIASVEGAIPEIVIDGENGLLFPKTDFDQLAAKIIDLAADPQRRTLMSQKNRERYIDLFTMDKHGERMIAAIEHISRLDSKLKTNYDITQETESVKS